MRKERATILVVDDEIINIQILNNALADEYNILTATMGRQAIEVASQSLPDLILLDVMMPDINGHEVCQTLKSNDLTKHIPIIFVTAQSRPEDEIKGLELGAVDYFTKPLLNL